MVKKKGAVRTTAPSKSDSCFKFPYGQWRPVFDLGIIYIADMAYHLRCVVGIRRENVVP